MVEIRAFLLYAKKTVVSAVSLDPRNTGDQIIPARQLETAVGVDFSYEDQYVYWSEITADKISRQFLNGSGYETVVSDGDFLHYLIGLGWRTLESLRFEDENEYEYQI